MRQKLALECIGNSDALYHDIEHTMLVTLVGHDILMGRALQRRTTASDYAHFILACLVHDIGFVRGIVYGDEDGSYIADVSGGTIQLPVGSSDAALAPYLAACKSLVALRPNIQCSLQTKALRIGLRAETPKGNSDDKDRQKISAITRVCNGCRVRGGNTSFRTNSTRRRQHPTLG